MGIIAVLSTFIIPIIIFYIVGYGMLQKCNVYEFFVKGAVDGFHTVLKIMPTLIGLMVAVGILRASGFLDMLSIILEKLLGGIVPGELVPLSVIRLFSASGATGLLLDIFKEFGTDSYIGLSAAIMMSCTETLIYCMSIYFGSVNIKKTRYTLAGALLATTAGMAASLILAKYI